MLQLLCRQLQATKKFCAPHLPNSVLHGVVFSYGSFPKTTVRTNTVPTPHSTFKVKVIN